LIALKLLGDPKYVEVPTAKLLSAAVPRQDNRDFRSVLMQSGIENHTPGYCSRIQKKGTR